MHGRAHKAMGLTLIEMTLVVGTIVLLVGLSVPAVRSLTRSFQSEGAAKSMIDAALSAARAMAMSRQAYVGVRFQRQYTAAAPADPLQSPRDAPQYMIFIVHDPDRALDARHPDPQTSGTGYANGFRAVAGVEPIKLPDSFTVMDLMRVDRVLQANNNVKITEQPMGSEMDTPAELTRFSSRLVDTTTFSIVFSPAGRLIVHEVRVWNQYGERTVSGRDLVFNAPAQVDNPDPQAMFYRDTFPPETGLGPEFSRTRFVICKWDELREAYKRGAPWDGCLRLLSARQVHVNSYTGHLILPD